MEALDPSKERFAFKRTPERQELGDSLVVKYPQRWHNSQQSLHFAGEIRRLLGFMNVDALEPIAIVE